MSVVLPAPLGPNNPKHSPDCEKKSEFDTRTGWKKNGLANLYSQAKRSQSNQVSILLMTLANLQQKAVPVGRRAHIQSLPEAIYPTCTSVQSNNEPKSILPSSSSKTSLSAGV